MVSSLGAQDDLFRCTLSKEVVSLRCLVEPDKTVSSVSEQMERAFSIAEESALFSAEDRIFLVSHIITILDKYHKGTIPENVTVARCFFLLKAILDVNRELSSAGFSSDNNTLVAPEETSSSLVDSSATLESVCASFPGESSLYFSPEDVLFYMKVFPSHQSSVVVSSGPAQTRTSVRDVTLQTSTAVVPQSVIVSSQRTSPEVVVLLDNQAHSADVMLPGTASADLLTIHKSVKTGGHAAQRSFSVSAFETKPQFFLGTIVLALLLIIFYFFQRKTSEKPVLENRGREVATVLDPLMTGDMALSRGDYKRAVREFTSLLSNPDNRPVPLNEYIKYEAEARLCLAYIGFGDLETLPFVVEKLHYSRIYDRTLISLSEALLEAGEYTLAGTVAEKAIEYEIRPDFFTGFKEKLCSLTDIGNAQSMARAFSDTYHDFHLIHKGKGACLYRVINRKSTKANVIKVFSQTGENDSSCSFDPGVFTEYFDTVSSIESPAILSLVNHGLRPFPFIVTSFVSGEPLDLFLRTPGKGSEKRFYEILVIVCEALNAFHQKGIFHGAIDAKSIIVGQCNEVYMGGYRYPRRGYDSIDDGVYMDYASVARIALGMITGRSDSECTHERFGEGWFKEVTENVSPKINDRKSSEYQAIVEFSRKILCQRKTDPVSRV